MNETVYEYGLAACRDSDNPWGIAVDDSGNVHFVIETEGEGTPQNHVLDIHYRVKFASGVWSDEFPITTNEPTLYDPNYQNHVHSFGHPSIIFDNDGIGLIGYLMDQGTVPPLEMRAVDFNFTNYPDPFGDFHFMSEEGSPYIRSGFGGARKVPVMSMDNSGKIYCFWPYSIDLGGGSFTYIIYFRTYDNGSWFSEGELPPLSEEDYIVSAINTLADPNGDIHLAIDMQYDPQNESREIYHCWYDVSADEWSDLEIVSELSEPDGENSILPYLAFSGGASDYDMHVVWQEDIVEAASKQVWIRTYHSDIDTWDARILIDDSYARSPCVATTSNGDIYVVWEDIINYVDWIYYKRYDNSNSTWSTAQQITANEDLNWLHIPTIIRDRWDNLHLAAIGEVDSLNPSVEEYEVFYSFWDAPPHAPQNLAQVFSGPPEYITITWDANSEPDMDAYMIIRRYHEKTWLDTLATVDASVTTYVDEEIPHVGGETANYVRYWIEAIDVAGQHSPKSDSLECAVPNKWEPPKLVADGSIPARFELTGNYPNPFNATTEIQYALPFNAHVTLEIYDILGRKTAILIDEHQEAGFKTARWNGKGTNGSEISTGIYIYRLSAAGLTQSKRMLFLK